MKSISCHCFSLRSFTKVATARVRLAVHLQRYSFVSTSNDKPSAQLSDLPMSTPLLREYQQQCISTCIQKLKAGQKRQVVSLPVGSGKTVVMAHLIPSIPNPTREATKTLVLAHRTELLDQAQSQIQRFNPSLRVSIEQGRRKVTVKDTDVIIASVQTLGRSGSNRLDMYDPNLFKAIIIDEAHHAAASTYTRILDHFNVSHPDSSLFVWGCSATVRRHDGISLSKVFDDIAFHMDFLEMIESGWLSPLKITTVETSVDLSHVGIVQQDFKQAELSQAVNVAERNDIIVRSWCKYAQNNDGAVASGERTQIENDHMKNKADINDPAMTATISRPRNSTLVFAVDIAHTMALCNHFRRSGYAAEYITSTTPTMTRYDTLNRFRKGEFPILVNCGILTEGTDIPSIDCILMARPTRSAVLFQQMFGRGMRLFSGKIDCLVIDFVDNFKRSGLVTFPTLMGLDPKMVIEDQDVLLLEKKAIQTEKQQLIEQQIPFTDIDNADELGLLSTSPIRLKITEYDDMQEFITTCCGLKTNIQQITTNAWVAVGDNQYALTILGEGLVTLARQTNGNWKGAFQRYYKKQQDSSTTMGDNGKQSVKWIFRRQEDILLEADTITSAIQGADTWVRHSLFKGNHQKTAASRFARFRIDPMTDKQRAILKRYKIKLEEKISKGQAMDLITRLKLGQGRIWREQAEKRNRKQKAKQEQSPNGILRRKAQK